MLIKGLNTVFFIFLLSIITFFFTNVISPYFTPALWAGVMAVIFHPFKTLIKDKIGNRNTLASVITLSIIVTLVFIPFIFVFTSLTIEINTVYVRLLSNTNDVPALISGFISKLPAWCQDYLNEHHLNTSAQIQQKLAAYAMKSSQLMAGSILSLSKGTFSFTVGLGIMLYLLFYLIKDGAYLVHVILESLPLSRYIKHHLLVKFADVSRATVKGTVVVGIAQGTLGGVAFWFAGVEASLLWGCLMAFLSLVPAVGSAIVWAPVSIYFIATGFLWKGLFLIGFFVIIVGLVDNILRPLLVGKDTKLPDYVILIVTLGGMEVYGINGLVIGPLIMVLFIASWNILSGRDNRQNADEINGDLLEEGKELEEEKLS